MLKIVKIASIHAGGMKDLADGLGISIQAIHDWSRVPKHHVDSIVLLTNGAVSKSDLRPDLFPEAG